MQQYSNNLTDAAGNAIPFATVTVSTTGGVLAQLFSDSAGTVALPNPLPADVLGRFAFRAANGTYVGTASGSGIAPVSLGEILLYDPDDDTGRVESGTLAAAGGAAMVGNAPAGNITSVTVQDAINELDAEKASASALAADDGTTKVRGTWIGGVKAYVSDLAADIGASLIGNGGESVADSFNALQLADYAALRAYTGPRKSVYVTGYLASSAPSGIAGTFVRDDSDTTSADNGVTVIVAGNGKRWKRRFDGTADAAWFGVTPSATAAQNKAGIRAAIVAGVKRLKLAPGSYAVASGSDAYGLLLDAAGFELLGSGIDSTTIVYTSSAAYQPAIHVTANNVRISDLTIDGSANATDTTQNAANCHNIELADVNYCAVDRVGSIGGHYGISLANSTGGYTVNTHNQVTRCVVRNSASSGVNLQQASYALIQGNDAKSCGTDGFKHAGYTYRSRVLGNTATGCKRDGFDFYDGFIQSVLANNVADSNAMQGYEIKGLFDGTDYVVRDSQFVGNIASNNTLGGFSIHSVRNCSFVGNDSTSNGGSGFELDTVQGCTLTGNIASRNVQHGFTLITSVSRTTFSGCYAVDNSWVDGVTQNGTYHGFNIEAGCTGQFAGCSAINGTTTNKKGGQGYGWWWNAVSTGSSLVNCHALSSVTGGFGGVAGWAAGNGILNCNNNGTFIGLQFNSDALTAIESAYDMTINRNGANATLTASRASGANAVMSAQSVLAHAGTTTNHPFRLTSNGTQRFEVTTTGNFQPVTDNVAKLGDAANRWTQVYANNVTLTPPAAVTPSTNGQMMFELTNDTTVKVKVKGSDGVVRSASLTLA